MSGYNMSLFGFFKKKLPATYRAIKLYSIVRDSEEDTLDRQLLIDTVLNLFEEYFKELPKEYDIHGPYGISKGSSVGIKAFRDKLSKKGHDSYSMVRGNKEHYFGFYCSCRSAARGHHELCIWYNFNQYDIDPVGLVSDVLQVFPINYGFAMDYPENFEIYMESEVKKSFLGISVSTNPKLYNWLDNIDTVFEGKVRDLYMINFLNSKQASALESLGMPLPEHLGKGIQVLKFKDQSEFNKYQKVYNSCVAHNLRAQS